MPTTGGRKLPPKSARQPAEPRAKATAPRLPTLGTRGLAHSHLTDLQAAFVRALVRDGLAVKDAAAKAGANREYGYQLLRIPHVAQAIDIERRHSLGRITDLAALEITRRLENPNSLTDENLRSLVECLKITADRIGLNPEIKHAVQVSRGDDAPLEDLRVDEIRARIGDLELALAVAEGGDIEGECEASDGQSDAQ